MIPIEIKTADDLRGVLKTYTGSSTLTRDNERFSSEDHTLDRFPHYLAYSRGKSTLVFSTQLPSVFLVEVFPKVAAKAWNKGLDWNDIQIILPLIQRGATLISAYGNKFRLQLTAPLREEEVIEFFKLGWSEYEEYYYRSAAPEISMWMK